MFAKPCYTVFSTKIVLRRSFSKKSAYNRILRVFFSSKTHNRNTIMVTAGQSDIKRDGQAVFF